ncbi:hypothetical protein, partial [Limosilactobacillus reuteri]|uniref:hypothetical protein n=1 Tax=Limosilactobacillus reuteri TaxID=1598 RepID=UPI001CDAB9B3
PIPVDRYPEKFNNFVYVNSFVFLIQKKYQRNNSLKSAFIALFKDIIIIKVNYYYIFNRVDCQSGAIYFF